MRVKAKLIWISLSVIVTAAACGGRSGIEVFGYDNLDDSGADAGAGTSGVAGGDSGRPDGDAATGGQAGGGDAQVGGQGGSDAGDLDASTGGIAGDGPSDAVADVPKDAPKDAPKDVHVIDGSDDAPHDVKPDTLNPLECVQCIQEKCGDKVSECLSDSVCVKGIQCSITKCMSGGSPDVTCMLECFDGDYMAVLKALSVLTCVSQTCGESCMSLLNGLVGAVGGSSG